MERSSVNALCNFFREMYLWEQTFYSQLRPLLESDAPQNNIDAVQQKAKATLADIYVEFGITGTRNRNRLEGLDLSDPPTYEVCRRSWSTMTLAIVAPSIWSRRRAACRGNTDTP